MSTGHPTLYVAEPPARYLPLPPLVVDCSTLAGIVFNEEWRAQAVERLEGRSLHAPNVLQAEIASVAVKKQRRGEGPHRAGTPGYGDAASHSIGSSSPASSIRRCKSA